jgi:hypothetical protein
VTWVANTTLNVTNLGAGVVTFAAGAGVTVTNTAQTLSQYQSAQLIRTGSNAWTVVPTSGIASSPGLTLVKSQVIGTTVSSVNVTSAFNTTYDNYKIVISGGLGSTTNVMGLKLGATATGYYSGAVFTGFGAASASARINNNASSWLYISFFTGSSISFNVELTNPFLAKNTLLNFWYNDVRAGGEGGAGSGFLNDSTSYTDFTITPGAGTLTGGTIYVYGYNK